MRKTVVIIQEGMSVTEASKMMREKNQPCSIVLRQGKPFGIITERDIAWKVVANGLDPKNVKIEEIMSTPLIVVDPDEDLSEAANKMNKHKIRRLVVVKEGALLGVLTAGDIMRNIGSYVDKEEVQDVLKYLWMPQYYPDLM
jgi:CBS domain-containing protein